MTGITTKYLTIFGAGSLGSEVIQRFLQAGVPKEQMTVCDPDRNLARKTAEQFGIRLVCTADQAICDADAIILALPTNESLEMLQKVTPCLFQKVLVITFSTLPISRIEDLLRPSTPVAKIRPSAVVQGIKSKKPITYGKAVRPENRIFAEEILAAINEMESIS